MEPAQHGVQDVLNISTEVHVFHRTRLDLGQARLSLGGEETKDGHAFSFGGPSGQFRRRPYLYHVHPSGSDESGHLDWWLALDRGYIKSHSASLDDLFNPYQFQKCRLPSRIISNTQLKGTLAGLFLFHLIIFSYLHHFLFLLLFGSGLFLYSLVIANYIKKNKKNRLKTKKLKKKFWFESLLKRNPGGVVEEKPCWLKRNPALGQLRQIHTKISSFSFSFLFLTKLFWVLTADFLLPIIL
ncbi:hypothetical protein IGI04_025561 [Brassica rapa subsp. trilocularis]|uniref:Uncharacterized protein n=1 Tax=Brassica rapa subsp. trilocularis TaxID=1813537 RepID=A0ABQ7KTX7_BRACM|nr:hypothetical protein IGI04_025561 [Brassica rapa subsp. trilocularis]